MNIKVKWIIRVFALVVAIGMLAGITLLQTGALSGQQQPPARNDDIRLSGQTISYQDVQTQPRPAVVQTEPKPALPRVGGMTELLRIFNSMGMLRQEAVWSDADGAVKYSVAESMMADMRIMTGSAPEPTPAPGAARNEAAADTGGGYSATNTQVQGIDEGDIVKTDGRYLYIVQGSQVSIVRADGAVMTVQSAVTLDDNAYVSELYVSGDRMVLVTTRYEETPAPAADGGAMRSMSWRPGRQFTGYDVYDVTDRARPVRSRLVEVEGSPLETRLTGGILYFAANKYVYSVVFDDLEESDLLPMCRDSAVSPDVRIIPVEDIACFPGAPEPNYLLLGAFDITGDAPCDIQSILGGGQYFYMNARSIYVVKPEWTDGGNRSALHRFAIGGVDISYAGSGQVAGQPVSQYCMDEYGGYFRIATTDWGRGNYVTVFDSALKQVGQTPALAPDESIQSVRFMGDEGYVVTYRQTDPLFALDLSDPAGPKVLGELKIPGFSQYLHPIGDGLMAGFGRHTLETFVRNDDGTESPLGAVDAGMKVSLFDVSDPKNPKEIDKLLLGDGWSEASNNPRAMMADAARGLFGFPVDIYGWNARTQSQTSDQWSGAMVIGVEGRKLTVRAELRDDSAGWQRRLCYIGNTLYLCGQTGVTAYSYNNFDMLNQLTLPELRQGDGQLYVIVD